MLIDFSHWGQTLKMMSRAAEPPRDSARRWPGPCPLCFPNLAMREKPWGIHGAFWLFGDAKYPRFCCVKRTK